MKSPFEGLTLDGWVNVLTGLGQIGKDKRESTIPVVDLMSYNTMASVYRASDLAARVVDMPASDMMREGFEVRIPDDEEMTEALGGFMEELGVDDAFIQALKWKRAYGGSLILIGANDGAVDLSQPLVEDKIKSIDFLNVFDAFEARPIEWQENPLKRGFSTATMFQINPHGMTTALSGIQRVHASRCLTFTGPLANRRQLREAASGIAQGWGDSVLVRCVKLMRDYDAAWGSVSNLLHDFAQAVYKIKGLSAALLADKDKTIKKRFQLINLGRSIINATLLDADQEEFERKTQSISGVPETLKEFQARVSAAAEIPVNKLFGTSASGMNSAGDAEERTWYDKIRSMQKLETKTQVSRLAKLVMLAKDSPAKGVEPENWTTCFHSLWQQSDTDKADVRFKNAQTDKIYHDLGVASTEDIANSRWGGDEYGMDLSIEMKAVEERGAQQQEAADIAHEATVGNLQEHGQPTPPRPVVVPPAVPAAAPGGEK